MPKHKRVIAATITNIDLRNFRGENIQEVFPKGKFSIFEDRTCKVAAFRKLNDAVNFSGDLLRYTLAQKGENSELPSFQLIDSDDESFYITFEINEKKGKVIAEQILEFMAAMSGDVEERAERKRNEAEKFAGMTPEARIEHLDQESKSASDTLLASLSPKARKPVMQALSPGELLTAVIEGGSNQAMVLTGSRLIVAKPGFMSGNTFGSAVTSFYLNEITALEFQAKFGRSFLMVRAPGFATNEVQVLGGRGKEQKNAYELPNVVPVFDKQKANQFVKAFHSQKNDFVNQSLAPATKSTPPQEKDLLNELERLISMREAGHIDDDEFKMMKANLMKNSQPGTNG